MKKRKIPKEMKLKEIMICSIKTEKRREDWSCL